ncbi:MAG: hypothetical protein LC808_33865, partial [Actinobacteria bacterium]|nr:hypothetical protein [Actinomycetota bacterium]
HHPGHAGLRNAKEVVSLGGVRWTKNPYPIFAVRHEGGKNQWMKVPLKQLSVQLDSYPSGELE